MQQNSASRTQTGQSLTEFALALPLLIIILLGALDLSRLFEAKITLANAAREGARYGMNATDPNDRLNNVNTYVAVVKAQAVNEAANSGVTIANGEITVTCMNPATGTAYANCSLAQVGDQVTVAINHPFYFISTDLLGVGNITLGGTASMVLVN
jgi:Flp pilus assembly protein TadG